MSSPRGKSKNSKQPLSADRSADEVFQYNLLLQAPLAVAIFRGPLYIIEMANDRMLNLWGKTRDEAWGKPLFELNPGLREQGFEELMHKIVNEGKGIEMPEVPVTLTRNEVEETIYLKIAYEPLRGEEQKVTGIMAMASEITEQVLGRQRIEESERRFRDMILQSPDAIAILRGKDFVVEIANNMMLYRLWQQKTEDIIGRKLLEVFPGLRGDKYHNILLKVYDNGERFRENEVVVLIPGDTSNEKLYFDFDYTPLYNSDNKVTGVMVTGYDMTDTVNDRIQLQAAEQRSRLAIEATDMGTFDWDLQTQEFKYSERLADIFGAALGNDFDHRDLVNLIHPDDLHIRNEAVNNAFKIGSLNYQVRLIWPDKSLHWVSVYGKVAYDINNLPVKMYGAAIDISRDRMMAEELERRVDARTAELKQANEELLRTNQELEQFAYVSSHDLQEPLRKIQTFSDLVIKRLAPEEDEVRTHLQKINASAGRMSILINDLLNYSRVSKADEKFVPIDLNKVVENILNDFEVLITQKNAVIKAHDLPQIMGIPIQINQLFYNLVSNALKFSTERPLVTITAKKLAGDALPPGLPLQRTMNFVVLEFSDNGIGFDQVYASQIFTIFQRLNNRSQYSGTGIGLAICKKIAENHGGYIFATSAVDQGSVFTVYLGQ